MDSKQNTRTDLKPLTKLKKGRAYGPWLLELEAWVAAHQEVSAEHTSTLETINQQLDGLWKCYHDAYEHMERRDRSRFIVTTFFGLVAATSLFLHFV